MILSNTAQMQPLQKKAKISLDDKSEDNMGMLASAAQMQTFFNDKPEDKMDLLSSVARIQAFLDDSKSKTSNRLNLGSVFLSYGVREMISSLLELKELKRVCLTSKTMHRQLGVVFSKRVRYIGDILNIFRKSRMNVIARFPSFLVSQFPSPLFHPSRFAIIIIDVPKSTVDIIAHIDIEGDRRLYKLTVPLGEHQSFLYIESWRKALHKDMKELIVDNVSVILSHAISAMKPIYYAYYASWFGISPPSPGQNFSYDDVLLPYLLPFSEISPYNGSSLEMNLRKLSRVQLEVFHLKSRPVKTTTVSVRLGFDDIQKSDSAIVVILMRYLCLPLL